MHLHNNMKTLSTVQIKALRLFQAIKIKQGVKCEIRTDQEPGVMVQTDQGRVWFSLHTIMNPNNKLLMVK